MAVSGRELCRSGEQALDRVEAVQLIRHSRPSIEGRDLAAVAAVLGTGMLAQGELTARLEAESASWFAARGAVAAGSGSACIYLALKALGIGPDDEVILPTYVCASVMQAVVSAGAQPVFCDVGPDWLVTRETAGARKSARTRAVIVPHIYGLFADVESLTALGVPVIEDFAQALPAKGSRPLAGTIGVLSFHPTKCICAGEGGIAITSDARLLGSMRKLRDGGHAAAPRLFSPLSDLASSLGLSQLGRYGEFLATRRKIGARYLRALESVCPDWLPARALLEAGVLFRFPLSVPAGFGAVEEKFLAAGVIVRRGVDELLHRVAGEPDALYPRSTAHFEHTVSLPIYPALTPAEQDRVVNSAVSIFGDRGCRS